MGVDFLAVGAVLVGGHQGVQAVVEVGGAVQLKAAVVLPVGDVMDQGHDVFSFLDHLAVQEPLQLWLRVPCGVETH